MSSFSIPVKSFRRLQNPIEEGNIETYEFYCKVKDVPTLDKIPMETNPREQQLTSDVAKQIRDSLKSDSQQMFHILNKGITLSADYISYDNKTGEATVVFHDPTIHGNIDGGHTFKIILENQYYPLAREKFVKFEVITNLNEESFVEIAEARNTAAKVEAFTIAELQNKFDIIKDSLNGEKFLDRVTFKQFEDKKNREKDIPVRQITAILNLFNIDRWSEDNHPITSYSGKQATVKYYLEAYDELPKQKNPYFKMQNVMKDIFKLHATLDKHYRDIYNDIGGNYLGNNFAKLDSEKRKVRFSNNDEYVNFKVPDGILLPLLAAFRVLLIEEEGKYTWIRNPFEYLEELAPRMMRVIAEKLKNNGSNPQTAGKDTSMWLTLFMLVEQKLLKEGVSK